MTPLFGQPIMSLADAHDAWVTIRGWWRENACHVLLSYRRATGLTQRQMADILECDHTYLSKLEHAVLQPGVDILLRLDQLTREKEKG